MNVPLELTGLTKVFPTPTGPFIAVKDVNASIEAGEFVAILGNSGCGKSTVLSILAGLDQATYGGVIIDGTQVTEPGAERAIVFQAPCLLPWLTARENVTISCALGGVPVDEAGADAMLERVGLARYAEYPARHLSQGQRRRVALARLAARRPTRLWVLDEPFTALDAVAVTLVVDMIAEHLARGGAAVITSHQEAMLASVTTTIIDLG